jgi:hypothetical protein
MSFWILRIRLSPTDAAPGVDSRAVGVAAVSTSGIRGRLSIAPIWQFFLNPSGILEIPTSVGNNAHVTEIAVGTTGHTYHLKVRVKEIVAIASIFIPRLG